MNKENYAVQFKFRKSSIAIIYKKNFYSSIIIVIIFTVINIQYQVLFNMKQYEGASEQEISEGFDKALKEFETYTMLGQITSFSCLMSVIGQLIFNSFSQYKVPFDKWALLDTCNAIFNTICFALFTVLKPDLSNRETKEIFNWIQVVSILVTWARFLSFFLVIDSISKLMLTIVKMIVNAMTFMFVTACYIFVMMPVFQLLFQEESELYVDTFYTFRTLFDSMLGNMNYMSDGNWILNSLVLIFYVFIANIFLLNYLIAILATVYEESTGLGSFDF